jgi:hypothetical protein
VGMFVVERCSCARRSSLVGDDAPRSAKFRASCARATLCTLTFPTPGFSLRVCPTRCIAKGAAGSTCSTACKPRRLLDHASLVLFAWCFGRNSPCIPGVGAGRHATLRAPIVSITLHTVNAVAGPRSGDYVQL